MNVVEFNERAAEVNSQLSQIAKYISRQEKKLVAEKKAPDPKSRIIFGRGFRRVGGVEHNGDGRGVRLAHKHFGNFEPNNKYDPTLRIRPPKPLSPNAKRIEAIKHKRDSAIAMSAVADRLYRLRAKRRRKVK